jgi:hypothetical protein
MKKLLWKLLAEMGVVAAGFAKRELEKKAEELRQVQEAEEEALEEEEPVPEEIED